MKASSVPSERVVSVDRRQTREATESRILAGATGLLDEGESLAALSVNRIAEASGVSRATFYLHFADKRELVARLAETELQAFDLLTDPFLEDPGAGREQLAAVVDQIIDLWQSHSGVLTSLIESAERDGESRTAWQETVHQVAERIASAIRVRRTDLSEQEVQTLAEIIAWTGERALHQMIGRHGDQATARRLSEGLCEVVWRLVEP